LHVPDAQRRPGHPGRRAPLSFVARCTSPLGPSRSPTMLTCQGSTSGSSTRPPSLSRHSWRRSRPLEGRRSCTVRPARTGRASWWPRSCWRQASNRTPWSRTLVGRGTGCRPALGTPRRGPDGQGEGPLRLARRTRRGHRRRGRPDQRLGRGSRGWWLDHGATSRSWTPGGHALSSTSPVTSASPARWVGFTGD